MKMLIFLQICNNISQSYKYKRKELQLDCYFGSEHVKLVKTPISPHHLSFFLLPRIIPFQRPLKIKELLQKVTEAFGQQMDMYFMEKEVQKTHRGCRCQ